ncbi:MAG: DegT/DnrJ/EryC1/StrS family aminotransferase, partial [Halobacteriota archaeon]|nr:DegT/DnrJ/EryC1/StrS family aminotransferase [Halobacteriota archaeon]
MKFIPYGHQYIDEEDIEEVVKVLRGDWITTGPKVVEFEEALCQYIGSDFVVAVNSGTSALDISVQTLDLPK